ncbi:unnamed protein product, partial [marine sediment metagenome]
LSISTEKLKDNHPLGDVDHDIKKDVTTGQLNRSRPDAWIYNSQDDFCVLIEAKTRSYPLHIGQLRAHSNDWYKVQLEELVDNQMYFSKTWIDILEAFESAEMLLTNIGVIENSIINHMCQFLGFFEYKIFSGFDFQRLDDHPVLTLNFIDDSNDISNYLDVSRILEMPPTYSFVTSDNPKKD